MPVVKSKIISRKAQEVRPGRAIKTLSLKEFFEKRNTILINRSCGGLGDILMHRMIFEDIKILMPDAQLHFACPKVYHDAVCDHPFIDKIVDCETVDKQDYLICYNTTTACGRTELKIAPSSGPHRSDIWANHCGFNLTRHNMHFIVNEEEKTKGYEAIEEVRDREGPSVIIAPTSAMINKNLKEKEIWEIVQALRQKGLFPFVLHNYPVNEVCKNDTPMVVTQNIRKWMGIINQANYVISVDTSVFHCAGGMGKPTLGIFTFANGEVYSKYYEKVEIVQGPCPWDHNGCYNWGNCPHLQKNSFLPCHSGLNSEMILSKVDSMLGKWTLTDSIRGKDATVNQTSHDSQSGA